MTPLLSFALGAALTGVVALAVVALVALTVLLVLLALLALDLLLERNGVDRRGALRALAERLQAPGGRSAARPPAEPAAAAPPRTPWSSRFAAARPGARAVPADTPAADAPPARVEDPGPTAAEEPRPAGSKGSAAAPDAGRAPDAPTEVLPVPSPDAAPAPRPARVRRAPAKRAAPPTAPEAAEPEDRDSAMDRLFAPLLETDRTEPLQPPTAPRPPRRRGGDGV